MRVLSVLGRTLWAALVLGLVAAVVLGAVRFPAERPRPIAPEAVDVPPSASVLVCPGPLRLATEQAGDDAEYDPAFDPSPVGAVSEVRAVTGRRADEAPAAAVGSPLGTGGAGLTLTPSVEAGAARVGGVTAPLVLRAEPTSDAPAWAAGVLAWRTTAGDLRGLAAASCQRPAASTWLVGGSTALGSSARLVLQNPGATPATVSLRMWGATGPLELAGAPEYLVPPGGEEVVMLEGVAAEQPHMVLEVTAEGGLVAAYLQDSRVSGLVPAGVELVTSSAPPALEQVVPAIAVGDPDEPEAPALRVLAPGEQAAELEVLLLGPDGVVRLPGTEEVALDAGDVLDIPLDGLPQGDYVAVVRADVPVVAGATVTRVGTPAETGDDAPVERAWSPSVPVGLSGPLALPDVLEGRLVLTAVPRDDGDGAPASVVVEALDDQGGVLARRDVSVDPGTSTSIVLTDLTGDPDVRPAGLVVRTEDARVAWAVVLESGGTLAVVAPVAQQTAQPEVAVTVR